MDESKRKRVGPKPLDDPRTHCISSRLNDEEFKTLENKRSIYGMKQGEYLRCAALDKLPKKVKVIPEINRIAWADLANLSNNINQIAKKLNTAGVAIDEIPEIKNQLYLLRSMLVDLNEVKNNKG